MYIDDHSDTPKYKQIAQKIREDLEAGTLKEGDSLLSINEFSDEHLIARDTVEKAYKELKSLGILASVKGKGYFVQSTKTQLEKKIFFQLNKLSPYKKKIYDSFLQHVGTHVEVDIAIHHNDIGLFQAQLTKVLGKYTHYVIIVPDTEDKNLLCRLLQRIPKDKLFVLDKLPSGLDVQHAVYQDFESDIQNALWQLLGTLKKYRKMVMVFPHTKGYAKEVMMGFSTFCSEHQIEFEIISTLYEQKVSIGKAFVVIEEEDLVDTIKFARKKSLRLGTDIGILSYNDTPLKEILENGISVLSTDFGRMGKLMAEMINSGQKAKIPNKFDVILRSSI